MKIFKLTLLAFSSCFLLWQCETSSKEELTLDYGQEDAQMRNMQTTNHSPYAMFGDSSVVLMTEFEKEQNHILEIPISQQNSPIKKIIINWKTGYVEYKDKTNTKIGNFQMKNYDIAKFLSVDPLAKDYSGWSPYHYAVDNPIMYIDPDGRSAVPVVDKETKTVTIHAQLNFYGRGATKQRASQISNSIQTDWNAAEGTVDINGEIYKVQFEVTGKKISGFSAALGKIFGGAKNNYINMVEGDGVSEVNMLGGNSGDWVWASDKIENKEYTHEFGHLLGWYDPSQFTVSQYGSHDYLGYTYPSLVDGNIVGIMTPSNAPQSSPSTEVPRSSQQEGVTQFSSCCYENGTMIRSERQVTQADIDRIGLNPQEMATQERTKITTKTLKENPRYKTPSGSNLIDYINDYSN
jgi:RHS repeat-associated protein